MRRVSSDEARRVNSAGIILCIVAALVTVVLAALPLYQFRTSVFTKKSGNTFVGDERYVAARAEVEEAARQFDGLPTDVSIEEQVIERVNSKGVVTSLVVFNIVMPTDRTGFDFMNSDLSSGLIMKLILILSLSAAVLGLATTPGMVLTPTRELSKPRCVLRGIACWLAIAAIVLVPVFSMNNNYTIERQIIPNLGSGDSPMIRAIDRFLYGGSAGQEINGYLTSLVYNATPWLWLMGAAILVMLSGLVLLCRGSLVKTVARGGLYIFVIALSVVILYPYYVMLITAFRSNAETTDMYFKNMLPTNWVWSNIVDITNRGVPRFLLNSLLLSGGATLIALLCGIPAAYAMARMSFKGKKVFLGFVIMSQMFAPVVLLVGISRLMNTIRLNDTITGLMFINAAFNQAFAIWLLRGTFVSISSEMEQAACIDGCTTMGALIKVLLPMAAPGIVTTLIFVFINAWNEYTISTVLISTPVKKPITVGITQFSSFNMIEWQYLFASALIATIPVIVMFMFIEKHLVSGLTSGGVKG